MPRSCSMTWVSVQRRWTKKYRGRIYSVSCRQLGAKPTKDGSWQAANEWWERRQRDLDSTANDMTPMVRFMLQDWQRPSEEEKRTFLAAILEIEDDHAAKSA